MPNQNAPIVNATAELYELFYEYRKNANRQDKYAIWQKCDETILDLLERIVDASTMTAGRQEILHAVSRKLNFLRVFILILKNISSLSQEKIDKLQERIDEIGRMLGGWIKATK